MGHHAHAAEHGARQGSRRGGPVRLCRRRSTGRPGPGRCPTHFRAAGSRWLRESCPLPPCSAAVLSGFFGILDNALRSLPIHPYIQGVLFIASLAVLSWLIGLPFRLYSTFRVEARFGFNRSTPRLFVVDTAKGLALSALLGIPVLLGLFWMMSAAGRSWWLWAFLATSTLQLGISVLYPLVIAPLFNRFTPLPRVPCATRSTLLRRGWASGQRPSSSWTEAGARAIPTRTSRGWAGRSASCSSIPSWRARPPPRRSSRS